MSFLTAVPELVTTAAGNLANLGSALEDATAAAAAPTTGVAAAAADEVSAAVAELFGVFGQEFQAVNRQAAAFQAEFTRLLSAGSAAYAGAEIANAAAAAAPPGTGYVQLFTNTVTNLEALGGAWAADPFPVLRQVAANQLGYAEEIAATIANFPTLLPTLPTVIETALQSFNPVAFALQFVTVQTGFAQTFVSSSLNGISGLITGFPSFASGLGVAAQTLLTGNLTGAVSDFGRAALSLLVTGVDPGTVVFGGAGLIIETVPGPLGIPVPSTVAYDLNATLNPRILGPLGDLFTILNIPGQEAQYVTNQIPPSIPRQMAQNFTNVLNVLTVPSISAFATLDANALPLPPTANASLSTFFGLPLVATYAAAGAPLATLNAVATSLETFGQALSTGDYFGAAATLFDSPAVALNGFLNGSAPIDTTFSVPVPPIGVVNIGDVGIVLHLPSDGLLVPPHPVTADVNVPNITVPLPLGLPSVVIPGSSVPVVIFGTPFSGLIPLLVNYAPQQLAAAIRPAA